MQRIIEYFISENTGAVTILDFLKREGFSRHILSSMKNVPNTIILNGVRGFGRSVLKPGDHLMVTVPETESGKNIIRTEMELSILYEDEDILVVNKPADMPIHPSINNYENTLANAVAYYYKKQGETFIFRCINRLDRDTTGLLIIAKHALSASILSKQMKAREIRRTYLAVCKGQLPTEVGIINAPIARKADSAIERCVDFSNGESAVTHYRVRYYQDGYSLVELHLETGRTNKIRIHMQYLGNPLPGDYLYCPDYSKISRTALHSYRLAFCHPITGNPMDFYAPLPTDMTAFFQ